MIIPAESAYGPTDAGKVQTYPSVRTFPRMLPMMPAQFFEQFGVFPIQGKEVQLAPFLKARVKEVTETSALLEILVQNGEQFNLDYGTVAYRIDGDQISATLAPKLGAPFKGGNSEGRITRSDGKTFTVDFNSPAAGKAIIIDVEVDSLERPSVLASRQITWIEKYDAGLIEAKKEGKPAVLLLYADWCSWCKKFQDETVQDPRIIAMQDKFVWIKVNSDKQKDFQAKYQQNGFPLILILAPDGQVSRRIDGYIDAVSFRVTLGGQVETQSPKHS
jgi:thiol-disulfide isomerase/thioredoxin